GAVLSTPCLTPPLLCPPHVAASALPGSIPGAAPASDLPPGGGRAAGARLVRRARELLLPAAGVGGRAAPGAVTVSGRNFDYKSYKHLSVALKIVTFSGQHGTASLQNLHCALKLSPTDHSSCAAVRACAAVGTEIRNVHLPVKTELRPTETSALAKVRQLVALLRHTDQWTALPGIPSQTSLGGAGVQLTTDRPPRPGDRSPSQADCTRGAALSRLAPVSSTVETIAAACVNRRRAGGVAQQSLDVTDGVRGGNRGGGGRYTCPLSSLPPPMLGWYV
ncbi:uncharacterized protein LOC122376769, partial [Amphibalanus amphitrite]|uniref:uncharacterized protein LOC122376769 n=1 Tax=Amphibalanus amphitrite TaxID=1232801 RepID=UPI001C926DB8